MTRNSRARGQMNPRFCYSQASKLTQDSIESKVRPCKINLDQIRKPLKIIKTPQTFIHSKIENVKMKSPKRATFSGSPARNEYYKFTLRENSRDVKYRIPSEGIDVKPRPATNHFNKKHSSIQSSQLPNEDSLFMV